MTTSFDASTAGPAERAPAAVPDDLIDDTDDGFAPELSALEQLRGIVEQREAPEPFVRVISGGLIRITCSTDFDNAEFRRWQRAALPNRKGRRANAQIDPTQVDQLTMATLALRNTCERIEVRNRKVRDPQADNAWIPVTDPRTGAALTMDDDAMLTTFRTPDVNALVKKLFGRDSDVIAAGMDLIEAAGYIPGGDDDESDPT